MLFPLSGEERNSNGDVICALLIGENRMYAKTLFVCWDEQQNMFILRSSVEYEMPKQSLVTPCTLILFLARKLKLIITERIRAKKPALDPSVKIPLSIEDAQKLL